MNTQLVVNDLDANDLHCNNRFDCMLKGFISSMCFDRAGELSFLYVLDYKIDVTPATLRTPNLNTETLLQSAYEDNYVEVYGHYVEKGKIRATRIVFGNKSNARISSPSIEVVLHGTVSERHLTGYTIGAIKVEANQSAPSHHRNLKRISHGDEVLVTGTLKGRNVIQQRCVSIVSRSGH